MTTRELRALTMRSRVSAARGEVLDLLLLEDLPAEALEQVRGSARHLAAALLYLTDARCEQCAAQAAAQESASRPDAPYKAPRAPEDGSNVRPEVSSVPAWSPQSSAEANTAIKEAAR